MTQFTFFYSKLTLNTRSHTSFLTLFSPIKLLYSTLFLPIFHTFFTVIAPLYFCIYILLPSSLPQTVPQLSHHFLLLLPTSTYHIPPHRFFTKSVLTPNVNQIITPHHPTSSFTLITTSKLIFLTQLTFFYS